MDSPIAPISQSTLPAGKSVDEIQSWIVNRLAKELRVDSGQLSVDRSILSLGVDSIQVVSVVSELEDWGGFRFPSNPLEDDITIQELAQQVVELTGK
ncbi:acyl carrier protein [Schlesneria sp. T3-172]|uniref:acyl carrier protein n=1 Tax=Schlesneria sphaerica TaxID=3373610 RepID=UPI0037C72FF0